MEMVFIALLIMYTLNMVAFLKDSMQKKYIYIPAIIIREDREKGDNIRKLIDNSFIIQNKLKELEDKLIKCLINIDSNKK